MDINISKHILIPLLCGLVTVFIFVIVLLGYQHIRSDSMEEKNVIKFVDNHKMEWSDLLTNNDEILPYLEQLYTVEDELTINYVDGELIISEMASNMFSPQDMRNLEELFKKFQWETIRLRKKSNDEQKVLEIISSQIIIRNFFRRHYGAAFLVYSPNHELDSGEEIFPGWYYEVLFNT